MTSAADPATSAATTDAATDPAARDLSAVLGPAAWRDRAA
ncbi:3-methyladenine DNA glycosylase, partial [Clavibacter michiganensis]